MADTLSYYRQEVERRAEAEYVGDGPIRLTGVEVTGDANDLPRTFEPLDVTFRFDSARSRMGNVVFGITEGTANPLFVERQPVEFREGENVVRCRLRQLPLPRGRFFLWVAVYWDGWPLLRWHPAAHVDVMGPDLPVPPPGNHAPVPHHRGLVVGRDRRGAGARRRRRQFGANRARGA